MNNSSTTFSCADMQRFVQSGSSKYSEDKFLWIMIVLYFATFVCGFIGNGLVIWIVAWNPRMRTLRNYSIVNLALSDMFLCSFTAPVGLSKFLWKFTVFGETACKVSCTLLGLNIYLSALSTVAIGLDRYVATACPLKIPKIPGIACVWLLAIVLAIPMFFLHTVRDDSKFSNKYNITENGHCDYNILVCERESADYVYPIELAYDSLRFVVIYLIPLCSLICIYGTIVWRLRKRLSTQKLSHALSERQFKRCEHSQTHMTHLLFWLVTVHAVCWLPLMLYNVVISFNEESFYVVQIFAICHFIAMLSSCINPVIYGVFNGNFREHFKEIYDAVRRFLHCPTRQHHKEHESDEIIKFLPLPGGIHNEVVNSRQQDSET